MRLIDADALKASVERQVAMIHGIDPDMDEIAEVLRKGFCQEVNNAPTIDPVKHGKWLLHEYPDGYYHTECSECGKVYSENVYFLKKPNYCPNCGMKMGD